MHNVKVSTYLRRRPCALLVLTLIAVLFTACNSSPRPAPHQVVVPKKYATLADLVPQVHSIVEGDVEDITFDERDCEGPRTIVHFSGVSTLVGPRLGATIELRVFGGPRSNGSWVRVSEAPQY